MALNRDNIQALADTHYNDEVYEVPSERAFAFLVDVASHVYESYLEENPPSIEDPNSFMPRTMGHIPEGVALILGLAENLEMNHPGAQFVPR